MSKFNIGEVIRDKTVPLPLMTIASKEDIGMVEVLWFSTDGVVMRNKVAANSLQLATSEELTENFARFTIPDDEQV